MIYTGKLLRAEIYDDHTKPYTNVKAVYEAYKGKYPGKLIVTNGHWYNTKPVTPCGNYKVNGTVLSTEEWMDWGFGWNSGRYPSWSQRWTTMTITSPRCPCSSVARSATM